ncbi:hypothetical protein P5E87_15860, partial [Clostridium perfringens]|nr:hypothetical protein [Clostridium perfringens]
MREGAEDVVCARMSSPLVQRRRRRQVRVDDGENELVHRRARRRGKQRIDEEATEAESRELRIWCVVGVGASLGEAVRR